MEEKHSIRVILNFVQNAALYILIISFKKFEILSMSVVITPYELYNTYVKINEGRLLDINVHNNLN